MIGPVDPALFQIFAERFDGAGELSLLDCECAGTVNSMGARFLKENEGLE